MLDKYTNRLSLIEVMDELVLEAGQAIPAKLEARGAVPIHLEVATQWERSGYDVPEAGECSVEIFAPEGELTGRAELAVDLESAPRSRVIVRFAAFRLAGLGRYRVVVSQREQGQAWEPAAEIPLYVKVEEAEEGPAPAPSKKAPSKKK
jgi:hypothetical protein